MKKFIPLSLICVLLLGVSNLQAQTEDDPWGFTVRFGTASYDGDLGNEMLEFGNDDAFVGLGLAYFLSDGFDLALNLNLITLDKYNGSDDNVFAKRNTGFKTNVVNMNLLLRWKFLFGETALNPYLAVGAGGNLMKYQDATQDGEPAARIDDDEFKFSLPFGAGINYEVVDNIMLNFQVLYNRTFYDELDGFPLASGETKTGTTNPEFDDKDHDDWLTASLGLVFTYGGDDEDDMTMEERLLRQSMRNMEAAEDVNYEAAEALDEARRLNEETLDALEELQEERGMTDAQMREMRAQFVRIVNNIQFEFDRSEIIEPAHNELNSLADVMQEYENLDIHIEAYADERGTVDYNEDLAQRRAQSVKDYLAGRGVDTSRITTDIYGETESLMEGTSETAYAQNRAVQITLTYNNGMNNMNDNDM